MSQRRIQIRPLAEIDLEDIYSYSYQEFGANRASQYIFDLDNAFNKLAKNPSLGTKCDFIKMGFYPIKWFHTLFSLGLQKVVLLLSAYCINQWIIKGIYNNN